MPRKKKIQELHEANGKTETFAPTTLNQIWGDTGTSKYGTMNPAEYENKLKNMNRSDLHSHARSLGIMPNDNYDLLIRKLRQEFLAHINAYRTPSSPPKIPAKVPPEISKILSEGR